jgi:hypothetical protein
MPRIRAASCFPGVFFHDHEGLTVCGDCEGFMIMGAGRRRRTGTAFRCGTAAGLILANRANDARRPPGATRRKLTLFSYADWLT